MINKRKDNKISFLLFSDVEQEIQNFECQFTGEMSSKMHLFHWKTKRTLLNSRNLSHEMVMEPSSLLGNGQRYLDAHFPTCSNKVLESFYDFVHYLTIFMD
jgi:hypothetical protein